MLDPPSRPHPTPLPAAGTEPVTGALGRLTAEFGGRKTPRRVRRAVQRARRELVDAPAGALPELVERLARERLRSAGPPSPRRS